MTDDKPYRTCDTGTVRLLSELQHALEVVQIRDAEIDRLYAKMAELQRLLRMFATALDDAPRHGADIDEPEGARWVQLSDTLALQWSDAARKGATDAE